MFIKGFPNYTINEDGKIYSEYKKRYIKPHINSATGYFVIDLQVAGKRIKCYLHRLLCEAFHKNSNPQSKIYVNHKDGNKTNNTLENLEWCTPSENTQHAYDEGLNPKQNRLEADIGLAMRLFLQGKSLRDITNVLGGVVSNLAFRLRELAVTSNTIEVFEAELLRQKVERNTANASHNKEYMSKAVKQIDKSTGEVLKIWSSQQEAARNIPNGRSGNISNVIAGRARTAMGFLWERV